MGFMFYITKYYYNRFQEGLDETDPFEVDKNSKDYIKCGYDPNDYTFDETKVKGLLKNWDGKPVEFLQLHKPYNEFIVPLINGVIIFIAKIVFFIKIVITIFIWIGQDLLFFFFWFLFDGFTQVIYWILKTICIILFIPKFIDDIIRKIHAIDDQVYSQTGWHISHYPDKIQNICYRLLQNKKPCWKNPNGDTSGLEGLGDINKVMGPYSFYTILLYTVLSIFGLFLLYLIYLYFMFEKRSICETADCKLSK